MGYFSHFEREEDRSYPSPEKQLLWRLDDLRNQLEFLFEEGACYRSSIRLSDTDIRYVIPEDFDTILDAERAIMLVEHDLEEQYGIVVERQEVSIVFFRNIIYPMHNLRDVRTCILRKEGKL